MQRGWRSTVDLAMTVAALAVAAPACASVLGFEDLSRGDAGLEGAAPTDASLQPGLDASNGSEASGQGPFDGPGPSSGTSIVLFGGNGDTATFGDTWIWSGATWRQAAPPVSPAPRFDHAMAAANGTVVLFGGVDSSQANDLGDTWTWDGTTWTRKNPLGTSPAPRDSHGMAALGTDVVLFGGSGPAVDGGFPFFNDTWNWDGSAWHLVPTVGAPSPRVLHAMGTLGNTVVMFGGEDPSNNYLGDTWVWDGQSWAQAVIGSLDVPSPRVSGSMATLGGKVYLFGGSGAQGLLNDTWAWDGSNWTEVSRGGTGLDVPVAGETEVATLGSFIVLFNGSAATGAANTWTFGGNAWSSVATPIAPPARAGQAMATVP